MREQDEKDAEEWLKENHSKYLVKRDMYWRTISFLREGFLEGRRILWEKIKADPTIGKLEIEDWPQSPDY